MRQDDPTVYNENGQDNVRSFMEQLVAAIDRFAGEIHAKLMEQLLIHLRQYDGGMSFALFQMPALVQSFLGYRIRDGAYRQRYQHFVAMKPRAVLSERLRLQLLHQKPWDFTPPATLR